MTRSTGIARGYVRVDAKPQNIHGLVSRRSRATASRVWNAVALLIDFRLYELRQVSQRLLPAEVTRIERQDIRQAFLDDV